MIADQQEYGYIESIFDGIVRLTGLDTVFYSELLFSIGLPNVVLADDSALVLDLSDEELEEAVETADNDYDTVLARLLNDFLMPFIMSNNPSVLTHYTNESYDDLLGLEQKHTLLTLAEGINDLAQSYGSINEMFSDEALKVENPSLAVNLSVLAAAYDVLEDTDFIADLEVLAENLTDGSYENQAEFLVHYVSTIFPYINSMLDNASNKAELSKALRNYFYALIESGFNDETTSLVEPTTNDDVDANDELNVDLAGQIATSRREEEEDAIISKTLLLVMGLERESIQAPMLTQTTQLYEGDLAWKTNQELEIYCSIEALGRISDIFLNSLE